MRILFVCPTYPLPLNTGSRVRWANLAKQLFSMGHTVDVLCFATTEEEKCGKESESFFSTIQIIRTGAEKLAPPMADKLARAVKVGFRRLCGLPQFMAYTAHPEFKRELSRLTPDYDTIFIEFFFMATNLDSTLLQENQAKFILVEIDISFIPFRRHFEVAKQSGDLLTQLRSWWQYQGVRSSELDTLSRFKVIVAMSSLDAEILTNLTPKATILVAPNGVDTRTIVPRNNGTPIQGIELLYVGGLHHRPNYDAITYFLQDILPALSTALEDVHLTVLGNTAGLADELTKLAPTSISFEGWVPDAAPYYERCLAVVVPLRVGGGTRLKILEAMAAGTPVIATHVGAEGIDVIHEETILFADTPEDFTQAVTRLKHDTVFATSLADSGRKLCESHYDWQLIATKLIHQLAHISEETP